MKTIGEELSKKFKAVGVAVKSRTKLEDAWGIIAEYYNIDASISIENEAVIEFYDKKDKLFHTIKYPRTEIYNDNNGDLNCERMYIDMIKYIAKKFIKNKK